MSVFSKQQFKLPPEQQAGGNKCFHPNGDFVDRPIGNRVYSRNCIVETL